MPTAQAEPMKATGEPERLIQPRCAAQATIAGAIMDSNPATTPMPKASGNASPELFMKRPHHTPIVPLLRLAELIGQYNGLNGQAKCPPSASELSLATNHLRCLFANLSRVDDE